MTAKKPYYHAIAFISDIHANIEALDAVLADIEQHNVNTIYCLGDLVGYGPDPQAVVQKIMELQEKGKLVGIVCGNHDYGLYHNNFDVFSRSARISNQWAYQQLVGTSEMDFLGTMAKGKMVKDVGRFRLVHSTWQPEPLQWEYMRAKNAKDNFCERQIIFVGHSHVPAIYSKYSSGKEWNPITLFENDGYFYLPQPKAEIMDPGKCFTQYRLKVPDSFPTMIINIGSVGQPRDDDCHARYVLYITVDFNNYIEFRQVGYNFKKTVEKMYNRNLDCDEELATRLCTGGRSKFDEDGDRPVWFPFGSD